MLHIDTAQNAAWCTVYEFSISLRWPDCTTWAFALQSRSLVRGHMMTMVCRQSSRWQAKRRSRLVSDLPLGRSRTWCDFHSHVVKQGVPHKPWQKFWLKSRFGSGSQRFLPFPHHLSSLISIFLASPSPFHFVFLPLISPFFPVLSPFHVSLRLAFPYGSSPFSHRFLKHFAGVSLSFFTLPHLSSPFFSLPFSPIFPPHAPSPSFVFPRIFACLSSPFTGFLACHLSSLPFPPSRPPNLIPQIHFPPAFLTTPLKMNGRCRLTTFIYTAERNWQYCFLKTYKH